ncbi:PTS fructose transporter subunit IIC [Anaerosacchariphilus polymeriproducens]|uniref:PTS fructose transporter subunit IIBC n=1 Tax=Anaerosacchariphilus polymeriproducens TaxID=1812858 RepID=A0A371AW89_9FIRM|nr:PTS fructose transporter subunit IIBC [Anaerosacchariphilus polymeriproducens]RDU23837.1 PTS fructose transporter subunit IIBC [Anaerosacchariphilus polymeriproducens]
MKIIGVTKCPTGIAHTYMAAEKLEKAGQALGFDVKIETQGSQGTENKLTAEEIKAADYVVICADVAIDEKERFNGKKVLSIPIKNSIKDPQGVLKSLLETAKTQGGEVVGEKNQSGSDLVKQLMNGASHMIPFVVVGGLFIALAIALGGEATSKGMVVSSKFWSTVNAIGAQAFSLMYPILAGFIAYSISGRASLAPAMISAMVAVNPEILGTSAGTGFLGCILCGFAAGYFVKWVNTWKVPKAIKPVMPIFVIPLLGTSIISAAFILILGNPISWLMEALNALLTMLSENPTTAIPLGIVLGTMIALDMGGPVNKVAFLFGVASITAGSPEIMGIVAAAIPVPPLATGLATFIGKKVFTEEEQASGLSAFLMGLIGITEGAIPFASADPKRVLPSMIVGSAVAGALASILKITDVVPHGGPIVGVLGATNNILQFFLCIAVGTVIAAFLLVSLKKKAAKQV